MRMIVVCAIVLFINFWIISFLASVGEPQSVWLMCDILEMVCDE